MKHLHKIFYCFPVLKGEDFCSESSFYLRKYWELNLRFWSFLLTPRPRYSSSLEIFTPIICLYVATTLLGSSLLQTLYLTDLAKIPWKKLNRAPSTMKASQDSLKSTGQICWSPELQTFHPHQAGTVKPYSSHPLAFSNVWQAHEGILHSSQSLPRPLHGPKSSPSPWHHPKPSLFSSFPPKWPFGSYTWTVAYLKPKACGQLEGKDI